MWKLFFTARTWAKPHRFDSSVTLLRSDLHSAVCWASGFNCATNQQLQPKKEGNLGRQNCSNREAWIHLQTKHSQDMFYLHSQVSRMGKSTACLLQYVLRPRRGLSQASPSLEAPRLQAAGIGDLFQKGKIVMIMWKFGERSTFFFSGMADHARRLGPYMRRSYY